MCNKAGNVEVSVHSMNGALVGTYVAKVAAGSTVLDYGRDLLSKGAYFITVKLNDKVVAKTRLIQW